MKKIQNILAVLMMFFIIAAALLTSVQIAVYGDPQYAFYQSLYEKYKVADELDMEMEDIMEVTDYMMAYLIGEEDELSIVTDVDGKRQDFFNGQDRLHMADVRNLFLGGLRLRTVLLVLAAALAVFLVFWKRDVQKLFSRAYAWSLALSLAAGVFLGIAFAIDFTKCFTIFHKLFFTNDLWLFDPEEDYMIRMLPEGFFSDMALRIGLIFVAFLFGIGVLFKLWMFFSEKRNKNRNDVL